MFERFTESARRALFFARYEVSAIGGDAMEIDHLLLGLLRDAKGLTAQLFARGHLSYVDVRRDVEARSGSRGRQTTSAEIPLSVPAKDALRGAAEEADRLGHSYIGTEHLLLGLLRHAGPTGDSLVHRLGLRIEEVRDEILRLTGGGTTQADDATESGETTRAVSVDLLGTFRERAISDTIARIDGLLRELATACQWQPQPRVLEIIQAIRIELESLRPPP